jgi:hypothetical protein
MAEIIPKKKNKKSKIKREKGNERFKGGLKRSHEYGSRHPQCVHDLVAACMIRRGDYLQ